MRKLLILGSDYGACDLVDTAHEMGLRVIVADYLETSPAKEKADESWLVSTNDTDELARRCEEAGVGGVMSAASDFNGAQARGLCKRLGIEPLTASDVAWGLARDKARFKEACREAGAPVAEDYRLTPELRDEDLAAVKYPVVVKPADKSGNRGMSYCGDEAELRAAYRKAYETSDKGSVVCERRLKGDEWVANYILDDGKATLLYFGRELHMPDQSANLYSFINTTANKLGLFLEEVDAGLKEVFRRAGFTNGIAWVETMLDEDGHFYLIDPAYRMSSETSYRLYRNVNGFDSLRWCIESAMGMEHAAPGLPEPPSPGTRACVGSYHLFSPEGGVVGRVEGVDEIAAMENVAVDLSKKPGSSVVPGSNMGLIRIYAETVDEEVEKLKEINKLLEIRNVDGAEMFVRYTDYRAVLDDFNAGLVK